MVSVRFVSTWIYQTCINTNKYGAARALKRVRINRDTVMDISYPMFLVHWYENIKGKTDNIDNGNHILLWCAVTAVMCFVKTANDVNIRVGHGWLQNGLTETENKNVDVILGYLEFRSTLEGLKIYINRWACDVSYPPAWAPSGFELLSFPSNIGSRGAWLIKRRTFSKFHTGETRNTWVYHFHRTDKVGSQILLHCTVSVTGLSNASEFRWPEILWRLNPCSALDLQLCRALASHICSPYWTQAAIPVSLHSAMTHSYHVLLLLLAPSSKSNSSVLSQIAENDCLARLGEKVVYYHTAIHHRVLLEKLHLSSIEMCGVNPA